MNRLTNSRKQTEKVVWWRDNFSWWRIPRLVEKKAKEKICVPEVRTLYTLCVVLVFIYWFSKHCVLAMCSWKFHRNPDGTTADGIKIQYSYCEHLQILASEWFVRVCGRAPSIRLRFTTDLCAIQMNCIAKKLLAKRNDMRTDVFNFILINGTDFGGRQKISKNV